jgi:ribonuclease T1
MITKITTFNGMEKTFAYHLRIWLLLLLVSLFSVSSFAKNTTTIETISVEELPREARHTLNLIKQGGPFPYAKDGSVFGNYEGLLPKQKRGYYHEFTVKTPRARNRGARRIVVGGNMATSREYYYTDNHYATFKRIKE